MLNDECDPLQLRKQAFARACPLLKPIARVANRRVADLVALDGVKGHLFSVQVSLELADVLADEQVDRLEEHCERTVVPVLA